MEQKDLQALIYAVHDELRLKFKGTEPTDEQAWLQVWKAHTEDKNLLIDYSEAMHQLATKIWAPRNVTTNAEDPNSGSAVEIKCRIEWTTIKVKQYFAEKLSQNHGTKLKLLDVGSCYNPFSIHSDILDIVPIDLCPAQSFRNAVYQGDFLSIRCVNQGEGTNDLNKGVISEELLDGTKKVTALASNYFDLIVFSFFLEYLPSSKQRFESCERGYELLQPGGILFILRPDSNSVTPSSMKLIKELKIGLACIGFKRLYCDKLQHLWAMGFVKLSEEDRSTYLVSPKFKADSKRIEFLFDNLHKLFSIPQDFKKILESGATTDSSKEPCDPLLFDELPGFDF